MVVTVVKTLKTQFFSVLFRHHPAQDATNKTFTGKTRERSGGITATRQSHEIKLRTRGRALTKSNSTNRMNR